jgi:hypothetical protein
LKKKAALVSVGDIGSNLELETAVPGSSSAGTAEVMTSPDPLENVTPNALLEDVKPKASPEDEADKNACTVGAACSVSSGVTKATESKQSDLETAALRKKIKRRNARKRRNLKKKDALVSVGDIGSNLGLETTVAGGSSGGLDNCTVDAACSVRSGVTKDTESKQNDLETAALLRKKRKRSNSRKRRNLKKKDAVVGGSGSNLGLETNLKKEDALVSGSEPNLGLETNLKKEDALVSGSGPNLGLETTVAGGDTLPEGGSFVNPEGKNISMNAKRKRRRAARKRKLSEINNAVPIGDKACAVAIDNVSGCAGLGTSVGLGNASSTDEGEKKRKLSETENAALVLDERHLGEGCEMVAKDAIEGGERSSLGPQNIDTIPKKNTEAEGSIREVSGYMYI